MTPKKKIRRRLSSNSVACVTASTNNSTVTSVTASTNNNTVTGLTSSTNKMPSSEHSLNGKKLRRVKKRDKKKESGWARVGYWTEDECERFNTAIKTYGRQWSKIKAAIGTRTLHQIYSHFNSTKAPKVYQLHKWTHAEM